MFTLRASRRAWPDACTVNLAIYRKLGEQLLQLEGFDEVLDADLDHSCCGLEEGGDLFAIILVHSARSEGSKECQAHQPPDAARTPPVIHTQHAHDCYLLGIPLSAELHAVQHELYPLQSSYDPSLPIARCRPALLHLPNLHSHTRRSATLPVCTIHPLNNLLPWHSVKGLHLIPQASVARNISSCCMPCKGGL